MVEVVDMNVPVKRSLMERFVFHGIVFNMSWEDPEMDRRAFNLTDEDTVISITSAGCNPLNFLCQTPKKLISIDLNPAQNAILDLKLAAIATLDHGTFFDIFAARDPGVVTKVYRRHLRPELSPKSVEFWDKNLWMVARNLYDFGKMGIAVRIVRNVLPLLGLSPKRTEEFFELRSLEDQQKWYDKYVAKKLWGPVTKWLCEQSWFMYLCGVHPSQLGLVDGRHGIYEFVRERIEYALTKVPIYDNYFLSVTTTGKFRGLRVPPYLLPENFETLRANLDRVRIVNGWLGPYLDTLPPGSINKFNLLDIMDWMVDRPETFEAMWRSILRAAAPGATLIYRSGSYRFDPPAWALEKLEPHTELAAELFATDRSATYGSFYIFSVPEPAAEMALA